MARPVLWIIGGPNGSGKTTLVQTPRISRLLSSVKFVNPDEICLRMMRLRGFETWADCPLERLKDIFSEAADLALSEVTHAVQNNVAVGIESVLSTDKYRPLMETVRQRKGRIGLIYVCLSAPSLSVQRVQKRFSLGGHDVPPAKIEERWHRSREKLPTFLKLATRFWVYDNSDSDTGLRQKLVAEGRNGFLTDFDESRCFPELHQALSQLERAK